MVAPPPCWGAQTTQSPLLQPWGPQDPGEALGDEQAKGHVAVDAPAQARLEVTRLLPGSPNPEGAPSLAAVFTHEGPPCAHPQVRC